MFSVIIVPNFINSRATCGIIASKEWFEDVNHLQTLASLNFGKLNVHPNSGIREITNFLNRWFFRVAIRNWSRLALTFPSSLGAIQHIRFGNIILCKLSSWQPHIQGICKRCLINIKVLVNNIIVFVTFVLSTNICLQYLRFRLNATLSMILCGAIFIIG